MARYIVAKLPRPIEVDAITWAQLPVSAKRPAYSVIVSRRFEELGIQPLPHWQTAVDKYMRAAHGAVTVS